MTTSCVYDLKKWFYARFLAARPEVVVIKELIWQEYLQLLLVEEKKYGNFPRKGETNGFLRSVAKTSQTTFWITAGSVVNIFPRRNGWTVESLRSRLVSDPTSRSSELWFCRKTLPAETCCRRTQKVAWGWNRVQKAKTLWTRRKRYWKLLRCRISSGHHAQQYRLCFAFAEVKISFPFPLASALALPVSERGFQWRLPSSQKPEVPHWDSLSFHQGRLSLS